MTMIQTVKVCRKCGSDDIEECVPTWWKVNGERMSDSDPAGDALYFHCNGCEDQEGGFIERPTSLAHVCVCAKCQCPDVEEFFGAWFKRNNHGELGDASEVPGYSTDVQGHYCPSCDAECAIQEGPRCQWKDCDDVAFVLREMKGVQSTWLCLQHERDCEHDDTDGFMQVYPPRPCS